MSIVADSAEHLLVMTAGAYRLALPSRRVIQITEMKPVTPLPGVEGFVSGLVSIGDHIAPCIDVALLLGATEKGGEEGDDRGELVLVDTGDAPCVLRVERSRRTVELDSDALRLREQNPDEETIAHNIVAGEFRHEGEEILLLDEKALSGLVLPADQREQAPSFLGRSRAGEVQQGDEGIQVLVFRLCGERFAMRVTEVAEVSERLRTSPFPGTSPAITGVGILREQSLPVLDAGVLLELRDNVPTGDMPVLVLRTDGLRYALQVDGLEDIHVLREEQIRQSGKRSNGFSGLAVQEDERLLGILEPQGLVSPALREELGNMPVEDRTRDATDELTEHTRTWLAFRTGSENYLLPVENVRGVAPWHPPAEVEDNGTGRLAGVAEIEGEVLPVLASDLLPAGGQGEPGQFLLLEVEHNRKALPIAEALHLVTLPESAMQHDIAAEDSPVTGIARAPEGMLSMLDPYRLISGEVRP